MASAEQKHVPDLAITADLAGAGDDAVTIERVPTERVTAAEKSVLTMVGKEKEN